MKSVKLILLFILTCHLNNFLVNFTLSVFVLLKLFSGIIGPTLTEMGFMLTMSPFMCYFPFLSSLSDLSFDWMDFVFIGFLFFKMGS